VTKNISIFDYKTDTSYLKAYLKSQPKEGYGLLKKWAEELGIHTTLMSQIMSETRTFTEEQALELVTLLALPKLESEFFLTLVKHKRSSTIKLKSYYQEKLTALKKQSEKISERVQTDRSLSEEEKAIFYSSWMFSAVRIACSLNEGQTVEQLHKKLDIPLDEITKIVDFLRETQMIVAKGQQFEVGSRFTHLAKGSIYLPRHHTNWRLQAVERAPLLTDTELMYTAPFSISKKHFAAFREKCLLHIQDFQSIARDSTPDEMACFNMDLFWVKPK